MIFLAVRHALRALLYLAAGGGDDTPVQISRKSPKPKASPSFLCPPPRLPRKFLEQILLELKKRGIVRSQRGRSGGYSWAGRPRISASPMSCGSTDGPWALSPCVSVMAYRPCDDCFDEAVCAIRKALLAARDATAEILELSQSGHQLRRN